MQDSKLVEEVKAKLKTVPNEEEIEKQLEIQNKIKQLQYEVSQLIICAYVLILLK